MVQTITTDFQFVTDGETTVENPGDIVGNNNIIVSNAEIEWEGTTETSSSTSYSTNTNTGSATATSSTQTDYNTNSVSGSATATETTETFTDTASKTASDEEVDGYEDASAYVSVSAPSYSGTAQSWDLTYEYKLDPEVSGGEPDRSSELYVSGVNNVVERDYNSPKWEDSEGTNGWEQVLSESGTGSVPTSPYMDIFFSYNSYDVTVGVRITATVTYEYTETTVESDTITLQYPSVPSGYSFDRHSKIVDGSTDYIYSNSVGESVSVTSNDPNNTVTLELKTRGEDTYTTVNSDTTTVSYPSIPSGHSFDRHYYREEKNGSFVDSDYIYSNKVGDTRSVTSNNPSNTWELTMQTRGEQTITTTTETQDPSVSGDVSASYNGTLGSQEYSSWQPLSGFELGDNTVTHDIGGTNEAFYRIRFDYELSFPTVVDEAKITVGNTTYNVILADPTDENVVYDFLRVNHPTHGVLAFDVVNKDNADAFGYYVSDSNGNVRALRENTQ